MLLERAEQCALFRRQTYENAASRQRDIQSPVIIEGAPWEIEHLSEGDPPGALNSELFCGLPQRRPVRFTCQKCILTSGVCGAPKLGSLQYPSNGALVYSGSHP